MFLTEEKSYVGVNKYEHFQVMGGEPLLKLLAVDWFTVDKSVDRIALHPKCLVQVDMQFRKGMK